VDLLTGKGSAIAGNVTSFFDNSELVNGNFVPTTTSGASLGFAWLNRSSGAYAVVVNPREGTVATLGRLVNGADGIAPDWIEVEAGKATMVGWTFLAGKKRREESTIVQPHA
jgi:hypothetical protein